MKVLITGGSGFIGSALVKKWAAEGHKIIILTRQKNANGGSIRCINELNEIADDEKLDVVVNLAGYSLFQRPWTRVIRQRIVSSRIVTTQKLIQLNKRLQQPFTVLISGSAVGIYGSQGNHWLNEEAHHGAHFAARLCDQWEQQAALAEQSGTRVCLIRTGIVLGHGGALERMQLAARFGLLSALGSGQQYWPWIDIDDQVRAIDFLAGHPQLAGPFNLCSPNPVSNRDFTESLAQAMKRKIRLPAMPAMALRAMTLGAGQLLLDSQRVVPSQLLGAGFKFQYENLADSLGRYC